VGPNDRIVVDSESRTPFSTGSWHSLNQAALREQRSARIALNKSKSLYVFQSPIHGVYRHAPGAAVLLVARVSDVRPDPASLLGAIAIAAGAALLVWLLIGTYFALSVSRPLLRITHATERMARGDFGARVRVTGPADIARLATSFNTMAEEVQQGHHVLRDFVANVSHDLRTPLTMISGFSQALLDGTAGQHEVEGSARVIHEEAEKMQRLVEDLLQLTRLESGLFQLQRHPTQIRPLVQGIIDRTTRARSGQQFAEIRNEVPLDLPRLDVDPVQLERALQNLLDNALQYTPSSGLVIVAGRPGVRDRVEIDVVDSGVGIPADDLPRVFERFYRSDKSRGREHGHSGLGLAIVREIAEAHGGSVEAMSHSGAGTTFRLTLPRVPQAAESQEMPATAEASEVGSQ
jgi:signal transduction histidine kinase